MSDTKRDDDTDDELMNLDEAFRTGRPVPEPWLSAVEGRTSIDEALASAPPEATERAAVRELFTPLPDAARTRIVDDALDKLRAPRAIEPAAPGQVVALADVRSGRQRWWLVATPAFAAAAALLLVVLRPSPGGMAGTVPGEVKAFTALRGDPESGSSDGLRVMNDEHFYLECRAEDHDITIEAVKATRTGGAKAGEGPRMPSFRFVEGSVGPRGARLHVSVADLDPGSWDITCGVADVDSRDYAMLTPSTRVVVER